MQPAGEMHPLAPRGYRRVGGELSLIVGGQGTALTLAIIGIWVTSTKAQLGHSLAAANLRTLYTRTRSLQAQSVAALPSWSHLHCPLQVTSAVTASSLPPPTALQGGPGLLEPHEADQAFSLTGRPCNPLVITNADFGVTPTCIHASPSWVTSALTLLDPQSPVCEESHTHTHDALDIPGHLTNVLSCGHLPILKRFNFCFKTWFYPSSNETQGKMTSC